MLKKLYFLVHAKASKYLMSKSRFCSVDKKVAKTDVFFQKAKMSSILKTLVFLLFLAERILGDCDLASLEELSTPQDLQSDLEAEETLTEGQIANFTCKDESKFLEPDSQGNNTLSVTCGSDNTFEVENWPMCVTKCLVEAPDDEKAYMSPEGKYISVIHHKYTGYRLLSFILE